MSGLAHHPGSVPPVPAVVRILAQYDREQVEGFIAIALDLLDTLDGDSEAEETGLEDSFMKHHDDGPGCPIADIDCCMAVDDDPARLIGDDLPGDREDSEREYGEVDGITVSELVAFNPRRL